MVDSQPSGASACVDSETLAAFVEGKLAAADRARIVGHLATCPDCSELVGEVLAVEEELARAESDQPVPQPNPTHNQLFWRKRRGLAAVGGFLALAASIFFVVFNRAAPLASLVSVVGNERLILARPTGGFHYGPLRSPMRGPRETAGLALLAEAANLSERATRTGAVRDLQASGVAQLLAGDVTKGIEALEPAVRLQPNDAAVRADLGAAYMTQFVNGGNRADADRALEAFDKALALDAASHEVWFNKALLLERLERPADALLAWNSYLALPNESGWHEEALRQRDALQQKVR